MSAEEARHLLARTGFSPTEAQVQALVGTPAKAAVERLLADALAATPASGAPAYVFVPPVAYDRTLKSPAERNAFRRQQYAEGMQLKTWWMAEMLRTPTPLAERMTLFWHNHFATSQQKVVDSRAMWNQHQLFRQNALGSFKTMLHAVAKDPAMLVYLDGANSRKEAPNENFAREVMELFVLGEATQGGGYTEADIKEAAKAFTGWGVNRDNYTYLFRPNLHDSGPKTVLGKTANFTGEQVLDLLVAQSAAPSFIAAKLYKEFVAPDANTEQAKADLHAVAQSLERNNWAIAPAMQTLLLSDSFWAETSRGSLIKSPIELVVGTVRQFNFQYTETAPFVLKAVQLGQNLLFPPNVKGWPGNTDWINSTTLLERKRFTEGLFRSVEFKAESSMKPIEMAAGGRPADIGLRELMLKEFADDGKTGRASATAAIRAIAAGQGREGLMRVQEAVARITFDPEAFLATYGAHTDREPSDEAKAKLAHAMLATAPTQPVPDGTVGVAYLRSLTLDPAYQLK